MIDFCVRFDNTHTTPDVHMVNVPQQVSGGVHTTAAAKSTIASAVMSRRGRSVATLLWLPCIVWSSLSIALQNEKSTELQHSGESK
jgi:hypothetical protein